MRQIRLLIEQKIEIGNSLKIENDDFHYLSRVMRAKIGDEIMIFNGFDGEFKAQISDLEKKHLSLKVLEKIKEQEASSGIILAFAPVKNVGIDVIAKKAVEMNVGALQPIITNHSVVDKINENRFKANVKEACEQCETNFVPQILPIIKLEKLLPSDFLQNKILILCDENLHKNGIEKASEILLEAKQKRDQNQEIIVFVGAEGGFSKEEFARFKELPNLFSISLGKRVLRADTAIVAALALANEFLQ